MNKLSGYKLFTLQDGSTLEVKFANGTYEIFAGLMGFETIDEIDAALRPPTKTVVDADGNETQVPVMTLTFLKAFRLFVLAATQYAALAQGKQPPYTDGWQIAEKIEEIGIENIFAVMDTPAPAEAKKKPMSGRVKASQ